MTLRGSGQINDSLCFWSLPKPATSNIKLLAAKKASKDRTIQRELEDKEILVRWTGRSTLTEEMPDAYNDISQVIEVVRGAHAYGQAYRDAHSHELHRMHYRSMRAIEICRTAALGDHVDECDECGALRISYNSCRNRHCPKCKYLDKERWLDNRKKDVLPVHFIM